MLWKITLFVAAANKSFQISYNVLSGLAAYRAIEEQRWLGPWGFQSALLQKPFTIHFAPTSTLNVWIEYINIYIFSEVEFSL